MRREVQRAEEIETPAIGSAQMIAFDIPKSLAAENIIHGQLEPELELDPAKKLAHI